MKREHQTTTSNPLMDFLQAHNAIFYSPLSQTDTTDWISGNAMTPYSANSVVWDSANQIWKFQHVSGQPYNLNQFYAKWDLKETLVQSYIQWTAIAQLYAYDSPTGTNYCYDIFPTAIGCQLFGTLGSETQSAATFYLYNGTSWQDQYKDGIRLVNYNYNNVYNFFNGTNGIRIGRPYIADRAKTYGMRNFAVFALGLTLTEINQYFALI